VYVYGFLEWCLGNFLRAQPLEKFISSHSFTAAEKNRQLLCAQRVPMHSTLCFCIKAVLEVSLARPPGAWFCVMAIGSVDLHAITLCVVKRNCASPQPSRGRLLLYVSNPPPPARVCGGNFPALEMRSCT
jgi:hypothetical protein